ncbi:hypothetical protein [Gellertiella hungarica]|uniref:Uncharacterized protein n=1 Tax=Gellertiella hungarica TaxID=1572859 RepID=A0A7W6J3D4_9HYPH|nr:hypothetical protein [Gellertiella hungarica]MBB4064031.1 hypothetical protein [Gellertiella hungarica]
MVKRVWNNADFHRWLSASGLSAPQAAAVLGISERTVKRIRTEEVGVKDGIAERAQAWIRSTRVTGGEDALNLDSYAAQADFAAICEAFPLAHITCMSSAIARGWTSANSNGFRQLAQPTRLQKPKKWENFDLEWFETDGLPWGVECRIDADGRPYRIASPERTLIELAVHSLHAGYGDDVSEAFQGAVDLSETPPDMTVVRQRASARSPAALDEIRHHLSDRARADVAELRADNEDD